MSTAFNFDVPPPLSLYVHLPWCVKKCPYCDFNSHELNGNQNNESKYIDALIKDLDHASADVTNRKINSIFIGGGTPSLFAADQIHQLLSAIRKMLDLDRHVEITLEANPGAADNERFAGYFDSGVNRLSIGVQSFDDEILKRIGRIHNAEQAMVAVNSARTAGFKTINLDIMYGLPEQQLEQAMADLELAIHLDTPHLSWYQLTIEPNTFFYKRPPLLPPDDTIWNIQQSGKALLKDSGFENYEISAFARKSMYCRHNLNYWQFGDYLGIGAGAHSKLTDPGKNTISRYTRHKIPERYLQLAGSDSVIVEQKQLTPSDTILEYMMNSLRLSNGFDTHDFKHRSGLPLSCISSQLQTASDRGWLVVKDRKIMPTENGQNFLNDLLQCFMPEWSQI